MPFLGVSTGFTAAGSENTGGETDKSISMGISAEGVEADEESVEDPWDEIDLESGER